ncbi:hypothetical protein LTR32_001528 [Rachicladosporium monterosium]|uniref:DUF6590 domain-containing protein n=1 Tax=Rachicladosporium monterosium TaxID=1507873 RepID=A0ABR0LCV6_9PEZI|nr:hypothetical protein LTR32_001528 [Rachicladosporium monterosium]
MVGNNLGTPMANSTVLFQAPMSIPGRTTGAPSDTASQGSASSGSPASGSSEIDHPLRRQYFAAARELSVAKGRLYDWETEKADELGKRDLIRDQEREPDFSDSDFESAYSALREQIQQEMRDCLRKAESLRDQCINHGLDVDDVRWHRLSTYGATAEVYGARERTKTIGSRVAGALPSDHAPDESRKAGPVHSTGVDYDGVAYDRTYGLAEGVTDKALKASCGVEAHVLVRGVAAASSDYDDCEWCIQNHESSLCWARPITRYQSRSSSGRNAKHKIVAIVNTGSSNDTPIITNVAVPQTVPLAIKAKPDEEGAGLSRQTRLVLSKIYTLEYSVKVRSWGTIDPQHLPNLLLRLREAWAKQTTVEPIAASLQRVSAEPLKILPASIPPPSFAAAKITSELERSSTIENALGPDRSVSNAWDLSALGSRLYPESADGARRLEMPRARETGAALRKAPRFPEFYSAAQLDAPSRGLAHQILYGTTGEQESLFTSFRIVQQPETFFVVGRAFSILWSEPAGESSTEVTSMVSNDVAPNHSPFTTGRYGTRVYSKVRRFVVVRAGAAYCTALPILTYGGMGVAKPGVVKSEHAIIYSGHQPLATRPEELPRRGELPMQAQPIRLVLDERPKRLDPMSRINCARVHTIEHNVKVKPLGMVHPASLEALTTQFFAVWLPPAPLVSQQGVVTTKAATPQAAAALTTSAKAARVNMKRLIQLEMQRGQTQTQSVQAVVQRYTALGHSKKGVEALVRAALSLPGPEVPVVQQAVTTVAPEQSYGLGADVFRSDNIELSSAKQDVQAQGAWIGDV